MIKVKDDSGSVIPGLYKNNLGAIVVEKNTEYERYIKEKQQQESINNLSKEVSDLKNMMQEIISSLKDNVKNG